MFDSCHFLFFVFKQKTAYEMRISDWSSDVCSSDLLAFSKKAMAVDVRKVLASAVANAENNHNLDVDALVIQEASVGKSISMTRWHAPGRGKSTRIAKPFSRIRIVVREQAEEAQVGPDEHSERPAHAGTQHLAQPLDRRSPGISPHVGQGSEDPP